MNLAKPALCDLYIWRTGHFTFIPVSAAGHWGRTCPRSRHPSPGPSSSPPHTLSSAPPKHKFLQQVHNSRTASGTQGTAIRDTLSLHSTKGLKYTPTPTRSASPVIWAPKTKKQSIITQLANNQPERLRWCWSEEAYGACTEAWHPAGVVPGVPFQVLHRQEKIPSG